MMTNLYDNELELNVLNSLISSPENVDVLEMFPKMLISDFYQHKHQVVFKAVEELKKNNQSIDIISVTKTLKKQAQLENAGGVYEVSNITSRPNLSYNFIKHFLILKELATRRHLYTLGHSLINGSINETNDIFDLNHSVQKKISDIVNGLDIKADVTLSDMIFETVKEIEKAGQEKGMTGVPTGFNQLDDIYGGRQPGNLIIIGARPGMGKTAYAIDQMINASAKFRFKSLFFSLEMTTSEIIKRIFAFNANIPLKKIKKGDLNQNEWVILNNSITEIENSPIILKDNIFKLDDIVNTIKKTKILKGLDIVFIDYLQLIDNHKNTGNTESKVSEISRTLKQLAQELKIPVIALSQLSRSLETRGGSKIPTLSDLRSSGSIEQDANIVEFLYRPEYYNINETEDGVSTKGKAFVLIRKNRDGETKDICINFDASRVAFFENIEEKVWNDMQPNEDFFNNSEPPF